ncbi:MAG: sigma factor [Bacteroidota bacterium]
MMGIIFRIVCDKHVAEDLLQEAIVKVWRNIAAVDRTKDSFFTWFQNITRNLALNYLRSKQHKTHKLQSGSEVQDFHQLSSQTLLVESIWS